MDTAASVAEWIRKSCWPTCMCFLHRGRKKRDCWGRDVTAPHLPRLLLGRLWTDLCSRINLQENTFYFAREEITFSSPSLSQADSDAGHLRAKLIVSSETRELPRIDPVGYPRPRSADRDRTSCSSGLLYLFLLFFYLVTTLLLRLIIIRSGILCLLQTEDGTKGSGSAKERNANGGDKEEIQ